MTSLRLALLVIGLGAVIVIALISYDRFRWEGIVKRKRRKRARWQEPVLVSPSGLDINPAPPTESDRVITSDKTVDEPAHEDAAFDAEIRAIERVATMPLDLDPGLPPQLQEQLPDDKIDFVAWLPEGKPIVRDTALGIYRQHEYLLEKRHRIFGLNVSRNIWRDLEKEPATGEYSDIKVAIQIVDRSGTIDESELNKFTQLGLRLAEALGRPIKFSMTFDEALEKAGRLEELYSTYDVLAIVNIVAAADAGFHGRAVEREAKKQGMQFGNMNIFHKKNPKARGCRHLYSLANLYKPGEFNLDEFDSFRTSGLSLFMNIPCTHNPPRVFVDMVKTGKNLCRALGGTLMDPDNKVLDDAALGRISQQIERIATGMAQQDIPPGGETAVRLF